MPKLQNKAHLFPILTIIMTLAGSTSASSAERGEGRIIRHNAEVDPGVEVIAESWTRPSRSTSRKPSASSQHGESGATNEVGTPIIRQPVILLSNCIPSRGGISVERTAPATASGECLTFALPDPPATDRRARRRGRNAPPPSPEILARRAADRAISLAPRPDLRIAPSRVGLTGLDSYFWLAEPPGPITATAGVPGVQVTAEARPVQYSWDFGDGGHRTTDHPGRPWTRRRPGNIAYMYETRGRYEVTVDVIWEARWRLDGGPWQSLGYFSTSDEVSYPVRQMVAVLTRSRR